MQHQFPWVSSVKLLKLAVLNFCKKLNEINSNILKCANVDPIKNFAHDVERSLGVGACGNPGNSRTFLVPRDTVSQTGLGQECTGTGKFNAMGVGGNTLKLLINAIF